MNTNCILKSVREVLERDRSSIDGDLLPVRISQATHALGVVRQIELGTVYAVLVEEPVLGVTEALLARAIYGFKIIVFISIITQCLLSNIQR